MGNLDGFLESPGEKDQKIEEPKVCQSREDSAAYDAVGWGWFSFGATEQMEKKDLVKTKAKEGRKGES